MEMSERGIATKMFGRYRVVDRCNVFCSPAFFRATQSLFGGAGGGGGGKVQKCRMMFVLRRSLMGGSKVSGVPF